MDKLMTEVAEEIVSKGSGRLLGGSGSNYERNIFYEKDEDASDAFFEFKRQMLESLENRQAKSKKETKGFHHYSPDNCCDNIHSKKNMETETFKTPPNSQVSNKKEISKDLHPSSVINGECSKDLTNSPPPNPNGVTKLNQKMETLDDSYQNISESSKIEKRRMIKSELLSNISVLDVKTIDRNSSDLSNCTKCDLTSSDELDFTKQLNRQCSQEAITLKKKCRSRKSKGKSKKSVYVCAKCETSYILSHESVIEDIKCLNCDYWTPEDPEFKKTKKADTNECKVS